MPQRLLCDLLSVFSSGLLTEGPESLQALKTSFSGGGSSYWIIGVFIAAVGVLAAGVSVLNHYWGERKQAERQTEDPQRLFRDLIYQLDLTEDERHLLREMTGGANLKHPVMSLASPGLLDWSRKVWLAAEGPQVVTPQKYQQVDDLCRKLFDQPTPSSAE